MTMHAPAPLPVRGGLNPTRVILPANETDGEANGEVGGGSGEGAATVLDYLLARFPADEARIRQKLDAGEVVLTRRDGRDPVNGSLGSGVVVDAATAYLPHGHVYLYRDPPADEPSVPGLADLHVLHRDNNLLVIDKPHNVSVMPRGRWVTQTALVHLRRTLDLPEISPAHRLDRPTAGVLVFTVRAEARGPYQLLFERRHVSKVYEAVAALPAETSSSGLIFPTTVWSRIVKMRGITAAQEVPGQPNAESRIDLIARDSQRGLGLYRLEPHTGKTHQLRLHMASLGLPILNDPFWPVIRRPEDDDPAHPLQLLARSLTFTDPFTGEPVTFTSRRHLAGWEVPDGARNEG